MRRWIVNLCQNWILTSRNVNRSPTRPRIRKQTRAHLTPEAETIAIDIPRPLFQTSILWSTHVWNWFDCKERKFVFEYFEHSRWVFRKTVSNILKSILYTNTANNYKENWFAYLKDVLLLALKWLEKLIRDNKGSLYRKPRFSEFAEK